MAGGSHSTENSVPDRSSTASIGPGVMEALDDLGGIRIRNCKMYWSRISAIAMFHSFYAFVMRDGNSPLICEIVTVSLNRKLLATGLMYLSVPGWSLQLVVTSISLPHLKIVLLEERFLQLLNFSSE